MGDAEMMVKVVEQLRGVGANVRADQLGDATPCAEWDVRGLLNHLIGGAKLFGVAMSTGAVPDAVMAEINGDQVGDGDPAAVLESAVDRFRADYGDGSGPAMVAFPWGEMPRELGLKLALFDVTVHTWDLAKATGQSTADLDPEVLGAALDAGKVIVSDSFRGTGMFDAEVVIEETASIDARLAAFAGRQP